MHQIQASTQQILNSELPLTSLEGCAFKYCKRNADTVLEPQNVHLRKLDDYWSEFLEAQQNSSANYIYKIQNYGPAQDPTLVKKKGVPKQHIRQLAIEMSYTAGLLTDELFYLLSFLLNLMKLSVEMQQQYMEHMLARKLIDVEIVSYLQMISHHPKAGLADSQQKEFDAMLHQLKHKDVNLNKTLFYNPEHIFIKPPNAINPYELEYLIALLQSNKMLTSKQTLYLAKFVYQLQQLPSCRREEYLQFFRENNIIPFTAFESLVVFLVTRAKRPAHNKLKHLLNELTALVDIESCEHEIEKAVVEKKLLIAKSIEIDYSRIRKAFRNLMSSVVPNIVRLTDLKNFLKTMMMLDRERVVTIFNELKIAKIMTAERFKYLENFINHGKLGKLDKTKRNEFVQFLKKMATEPINRDVMLKLDLPIAKGPRIPAQHTNVSAESERNREFA